LPIYVEGVSRNICFNYVTFYPISVGDLLCLSETWDGRKEHSFST